MEVHKHPHHVTHKKKWTEYLLEFFMLFLAVFLGFVAENVRENISDREKEKHFVEGIIRELKLDTVAQTSFFMASENKLIRNIDSALRIPTEQLHDINKQDTFYYHFLIFFNTQTTFKNHDNTLTELQNSGGYNILSKEGVADSIIALVTYFKTVKANEDFYHDDFLKVENFAPQLIKIPYMYVPNDFVIENYLQGEEVFTQYSKPLLEQLYSLIIIEKVQLEWYARVVKNYKKRAADLIVFLQKQYHLENE